MAYQTYITEALVCGSKDSNTSDRAFLLFTKEAGMLWANARSVREEKSKHRYALQDFSLARVSLVHGKTGWKVTGAEPIRNLYTASKNRGKRRLVRNIIRLLKRVLHGEVAHPSIFEDVCFVTDMETENYDDVELVFTLRMLHTLGYIVSQEPYKSLLNTNIGSACIEELTEQKKNVCTRVVAEAFESSQL